jgi:hypothetical protein
VVEEFIPPLGMDSFLTVSKPWFILNIITYGVLS